MKTYRWGILGAGKIAQKFCTALNFVNGAQVYAIASRNAEHAQAFAVKYNAAKFYTSYLDLVTDPDIDIIYIATPHAFHHEHTMLCLQHCKPVLCEKPMSLNSSLSKEMTDFATQQGIFLMEGLWTRCMPFIEKILSLIAEDAIGTIKHIQADFGFAAPFDTNGRLFNKSLGGGSVLDVGIYPIFLATLLLGKPTTVHAIVNKAETGVDVSADMLLQYADGATAHLLSSIGFNTPITATILGTKGRIAIHNPFFKATDLSLVLNDGTTKTFAYPHLCNGFEYEIEHVMYCLENGLLQSPKLPHHFTLQLSTIMDEVLRNLA
ncbi:Gfo/Idh/MocA family protein [Parasediminibacterium paludis]|uniref:Gfo/Idh/MocA family protein n=1 Tax=Parasediminibacterium paludis TaxID=908966 RepID=A0ABV8PXP7_9BACT